MAIIRQGSLFDLQELYNLEPTHRFEAVFSAIDIEPIFAVVTKKSRFGRPVELNYAAMIYSLVARLTERIPFIKDLVKRLKNDMIFRLDCGFLVSDTVPSEAAYSRMVTIISESNVLEEVKEMILHQAISEGFITDDTIAIDATHFEAKDQAPPKEEKPKIEPKKRGRKSKEEREQWLIEKTEREASLPLFEKKIEEQLDVPLEQLRAEIP
ncbi:transposase, partial [Butyricicoccus sp. 1XD8-22]